MDTPVNIDDAEKVSLPIPEDEDMKPPSVQKLPSNSDVAEDVVNVVTSVTVDVMENVPLTSAIDESVKTPSVQKVQFDSNIAKDTTVNVDDSEKAPLPSPTNESRKPTSAQKLKSTKHKPDSDELIGSTFKHLIIAVFVLGFVLVVGAIIYIIVNRPSLMEAIEEASCRAVERAVNENQPLSPIFANRCRKRSCVFDTQACSITCPFGYTTDINTGCETDCACASTDGLFDGDIQFDADDIPGLFAEFVEGEGTRNATVFAADQRTLDLWPVSVDNRVEVPFEVDPTLVSNGRTALYEAADWLKNNTCVDLIPKRETDFIVLRVSSKGPCRSRIGFKRKVAFVSEIYKQDLVISDGCDDVSAVLHLLFHALGFYHEQSRPDRDAFITLDEAAVNFALKSQYDPTAGDHADRVDLLFPYNVKSIMHHTSDMEVKEGDFMFIRKSSGEPQLTRPVYPDLNDISELHYLYGCNTTISRQLFEVYAESAADDEPGYVWGQVSVWSEWSSWSDCFVWCGNSSQTRYQSKMPIEHGDEGKWERKMDERPCNNPPCPDTSFGEWGPFDECTATCGGATQSRYRDCFPKVPCDRSDWQAFIQKKECNTIPCTGATGPVEKVVTWQEWGGWGACSRTMCLLGESASRERFCYDQLFRKSDDCPNKQVPEGDEEDYFGRSVERRQCVCSEEDTRKRITFGTTTLATVSTSDPSLNMFAPASELLHNYFSLCNFNERNDRFPKWLSGEYDSRPGADWVCHDTTLGYYTLGYTNDEGKVLQSDYAAQLPLCKRLYTGDFNNDGKDDLLCVDPENNEMAAHLNENDLFLGEPVVFDTFCVETADRVIVSDVNGDGKADVVCIEPSGHITVRLNVKNDW